MKDERDMTAAALALYPRCRRLGRRQRSDARLGDTGPLWCGENRRGENEKRTRKREVQHRTSNLEQGTADGLTGELEIGGSDLVSAGRLTSERWWLMFTIKTYE